ncbi:MAG TPA: SulP family inorganic anion transporter [Thermoleophilia bacterium]|nr:SulP family inorganic anion transporter [Thermoleophilia bacterium]
MNNGPADTQPAAGQQAGTRPVPTAASTLERWLPIAVWLPKYRWGAWFPADLIAAISVAALLIPESMGYATVAGVPVQIGLYCAPLALIGYALLGGSRILVFAAAGSVAAVSAGVVGGLSGGDAKTAITLTAALALATGVVFLVAGLVKMGWIVNFISRAVMAGFITGMAIQIIVGQLHGLFGIEVSGDDTFAKLWSVVTQIGSWNLTATVIGVGSLVLIFALGRFIPKVPAALTAVILASLIVAALDPDIDLVAKIPQGLPSFGLPTGIDASTWLTVLLGGAVVALVGFSEGWGAAKTVAKKTHDQLNPNQEFIASGVGNIGAGLMGGMAVGGSLSKSSAALASGAKTQMTNILLAGVVLLTLALLAPAFQWLPETVLAAIVIMAMSGSADPRKLMKFWRLNRIDFVFGVITAIVVLGFDLLPAMITGIVLSIVYLVFRVSFPAVEELGWVEESGDFISLGWRIGRRHGADDRGATRVAGVSVLRFASPIFFSNAGAFEEQGKEMLIAAAAAGALPHTLVIDCEEVFYIDTTGTQAVAALHEYAARYDVGIALARLHIHARKALQIAGVLEQIGEQNVYDTVRNAVQAVTPPTSGESEPHSGSVVSS